MNVLFVASECTPFFKTGGLADVVGSLPKALKKEGVYASVILPKYKQLPETWQQQLVQKAIFTVPVKWRNQYCGLEQLVHEGITYYFIDNQFYFYRETLYGQFDDAERFTFFTHAVLAALPQLDRYPDLVHCHDWQTGLIPAYMKTGHVQNPLPAIFTIHNLRYQGSFPPSIFEELLHFNREHFAGLEMNGAINLLKGALVHADWVTTVSPTYANEIQTKIGGEGLHHVLAMKRDSLSGILNGIDEDDFNPETDPNLTKNYKQHPKKKRENKQLLQKKFGLPPSKKIPLIAIVSRLAEEKGLALIASVLHEWMTNSSFQLIVLGTGEPHFERTLSEAAQTYPEQIGVKFTFNEGLARQVYAAADFLLMPSQFEPCGLSQLIAIKYETVPIVRETGGLADTIQSFNEHTEEGNGFSFKNYNADDMLYTIRRALSFYKDEKAWSQLLRNIYRTKVGWNISAKQYKKLYQQLVSKGEFMQ
ncbi:glycogen synthase GlgA [Halalkalibacterium ligniniphilum]|uniref:glycogen synthase GlgA n=1 Tax=Halalkalibacterium ligniniphilum TaxID=1134413 RepID=UPI0003740132|nr:glycogen synthase GlgA [Halalkalibacterium ligniniphilum]